MIKAKQLIFLLLISLCNQAAQAQNGSIDSMIQKLFFALKTKDTTSYLKLFANGRQMDQLYGLGLEKLLTQEGIKKGLERGYPNKKINADSVFENLLHQFSAPGIMEKRKEVALERFRDVIEEGEKKHVDWEVAQFISYHLDTIEVNKEQIKSTGVKNLMGVIDFSSNDSIYQLSLYDLIYLPLEKSWFEGQFKEVIRKGEQFTPDVIERRDIILTDVREDEPPPPPPLKKKVKAKGKTITSKTKTKPTS